MDPNPFLSNPTETSQQWQNVIGDPQGMWGWQISTHAVIIKLTRYTLGLQHHLSMMASPFTSHIIINIHQQWRIDTKSDTTPAITEQPYTACRYMPISHTTNQDNGARPPPTHAHGAVQWTGKMPIKRKSIIYINYARRTVLGDHWRNLTNTPASIYTSQLCPGRRGKPN